MTQIASQSSNRAPPVRVRRSVSTARTRPEPAGTRVRLPHSLGDLIGLRETDLTPAHRHMHTHLPIFGALHRQDDRPTRSRATVPETVPVRFPLATTADACWTRCRTPICWAPARDQPQQRVARRGRSSTGGQPGGLPPTDLTTAQLRHVHGGAIDAASGRRLAHDRGCRRGPPPMAPLASLLPAAADIGLHIIVTCQMSQAYKANQFEWRRIRSGARQCLPARSRNS